MAEAPSFTYFSATALAPLLEVTEGACECCGKRPGKLYRGPFYSIEEVEYLCLDCIDSGAAAAKFDGSFNDIVVEWDGRVIDAEAAKAPASVLDELRHRTPGYETWQGNRWIFHCGDGGVYQGDASAEAVANASPEARAHFDEINSPGTWARVLEGWTPQSHPSVYHFKCRKCAMDLFLWDMS